MQSIDGTVSFNMAARRTGTVSAESGTFNLVSGGTISGTASAAAGAVLQFGSSYTFADGAQFAGAGLVQFNNATITNLFGTIINNGNVLINSTGSFTDFILNGDVTFTGSGLLSLVNADRIRGSGVLTNAGNTIQGETNNSGSLGNNEIGMVNQAGGIDRCQRRRARLESRSQQQRWPNESRLLAGQQRRLAPPQRQRRRRL